MKKIIILGVPVHNLTYPEAIYQIEKMIREGSPHQVVTVNPEFLVIASENKEFKEVLKNADLSLADGVGLQLAALTQGERFVSRVTGSELLENIAPVAAKKDWRLFFLGGEKGVAKKAAENLEKKHKGIKIKTSFENPTSEGAKRALTEIKKFSPHILFVAYGAPTQDLWIHKNFNKLNVPVMIGVGGAFDYLAGKAKRPPQWIRKIGLEWLWRLINEPWRWKRQLRLPLFIFLVLKERVIKRQNNI